MSYDKDARISTLPQYMKYLDSILDDDLDRIISNLSNQPKLKIGTDCSGIDAPIHALKLKFQSNSLPGASKLVGN